MLCQSIFFLLFAGLAASAKAADSCAVGAILGIYAMCGDSPVDCGSGRCCLAGQKCVVGGCTDPTLIDNDGKEVTVNAACYGTMLDHMTPPSSSASSAPAVIVTNPATIDKPSGVPKNIGQTPSLPTSGIPTATTGLSSGAIVTNAPYNNGTYPTATGASSSSTGLPFSSGASSASTASLLLAAVGVLAGLFSNVLY